MRRFAVFSLILVLAVVVEEATQGLLLGLRPLRPLCDAVGGKHANNSFSTRCFTRMCYWLGDCGHWAAPTVWSERVKPGDPVSKVVLWLGEPDQQEGDDLLWSDGKGGDGWIRAVIRNGHLVALERSPS
jgi:hypothetical protein